MVSVICTYCTTSQDTISNKQNLVLYRKLMQKKKIEWVFSSCPTKFFMQHSQHIIPSGKNKKHGHLPRESIQISEKWFSIQSESKLSPNSSPLKNRPKPQKERVVRTVFQVSKFQVRAISCRECEYPILYIYSWWLNQPLWKIFVKMDYSIFPNFFGGEHSKNIWNHHPVTQVWLYDVV